MILIVEDEEPLARLYARALRNRGYAVEYVANGEEALSIVSRRSPGLIVTDVALSGRLNGLEFAQRAWDAGYSGPIALISGAVDLNDASISRLFEDVRDKFSACLQKPIRLDELTELADRLIDNVR